MPEILAAGMDVGYRCTGLTLFELNKEDLLLEACSICPKPTKDGSAVLKDVTDCYALLDGMRTILRKWKPKAVFVELPSGGAQSSRAARCMGMATALVLPFLQYEDFGFELYAPNEVETELGIHLNPGEAKKLGLKKGEMTKWKKARAKTLVEKEWPDFKGWPERAALAEDAYDSAAAFLCGRARNRLYKRLRA